jgi:hypothetical protein
MRDTLHIRSIMRKHGKAHDDMYTNKYKNKRTVKCYAYGKETRLINELRANGYTVRYYDNSHMYRAYNSIVVDAAL